MDGDVNIDLHEVSLLMLLWRVGFSDCPENFLQSQCHSQLWGLGNGLSVVR